MKKQNESQRKQQSKREEVLEKPARKRQERPEALSAGLLIKTGLRAGHEAALKQVQ